MIADKDYDSDAFIALIEQMGAIPVIPTRKNRKESRFYDPHLYDDEEGGCGLSRSTRLAKRYVQNALENWVLALFKPMTEQLVKAAAGAPEHPEAKKRLEVLLRGWTEQLKVHISYQDLKGDKPMNHTLSPYLIEPSPWSDSVYVIAKTNVWDGDPTPFQLERWKRPALAPNRLRLTPNFSRKPSFNTPEASGRTTKSR